uniref:Secreted protein n=1 Tax=Anopheles coluzzii TaxID=1518534 RepID=A0A8W7PY46_ANOCL
MRWCPLVDVTVVVLVPAVLGGCGWVDNGTVGLTAIEGVEGCDIRNMWVHLARWQYGDLVEARVRLGNALVGVMLYGGRLAQRSPIRSGDVSRPLERILVGVVRTTLEWDAVRQIVRRWAQRRVVVVVLVLLVVVAVRVADQGRGGLARVFVDLRLEVAVVAGERWERFPVAVDVAGAAGRHFEDVHVQSPGGVPAEQAMVVVDLHAPRPEVVRQP